MSFEHRKYHWLYFLAGLLLAIIIGTLMGCDRGQTTVGVLEREEPPACCMAFIPSCMACGEVIPIDEWIENTCGTNAIDAEYAGWNDETGEPVWLCQAEIIN